MIARWARVDLNKLHRSVFQVPGIQETGKVSGGMVDAMLISVQRRIPRRDCSSLVLEYDDKRADGRAGFIYARVSMSKSPYGEFFSPIIVCVICHYDYRMVQEYVTIHVRATYLYPS